TRLGLRQPQGWSAALPDLGQRVEARVPTARVGPDEVPGSGVRALLSPPPGGAVSRGYCPQYQALRAVLPGASPLAAYPDAPEDRRAPVTRRTGGPLDVSPAPAREDR